MAFGSMELGGEDEDSGRPMSDMNVTPLVDVMLVLLIVFMVAAPMMVVGVPVNLPKTSAARASSPVPPVVLTVRRDGSTFIKQDAVGEADLAARIKAAQGGNDETPVYVRGDREAPYGVVLRVMGRLNSAGINKVSLIAEAEATAAPIQAR